MPILGLVLTLDLDSQSRRERTLVTLRTRANLDVGELQGMKLPVVLECVNDIGAPTTPRSEGKTLEVTSDARVESEVDALRTLAGVTHVDVVFAEFADLLPDEPPTADRSTPEHVALNDHQSTRMEPKSWS
jgi:hypothetical protein